MMLEVVWNGAVDRAWAVERWRQAPPLVPGRLSDTIDVPACADPNSTRACDRVLVYLRQRPQEIHTAPAVGRALGLKHRDVATWLRRFADRGYVQLTRRPRHNRDRRLYRVLAPAAETHRACLSQGTSTR